MHKEEIDMKYEEASMQIYLLLDDVICTSEGLKEIDKDDEDDRYGWFF